MKTLAPATQAPHTVMMVNTYNNEGDIMNTITVTNTTHMFHVEHILVPDSEEQQHGQDRAANEGHVPGDDGGEGGDEDVHVVGGWLVSSGQAGGQLVLKLIEMPAGVK